METKFNFNSSPCTSIEQSKRLLALGLKKETADCYYWQECDQYGDPNGKWHLDILNDGTREHFEYLLNHFGSCLHLEDALFIPAWSLGRLLEICGKDRLPISFYKKGKVKIRVNHIHPTHDGRSGYNYYYSIIDCIEWLIKEGYFNKEYLEAK